MQMDGLLNRFPCVCGSVDWTLPDKSEWSGNFVAITPIASNELSTKRRANIAVKERVLESPGPSRVLQLASTYLPPPLSQMPGR